MINEKTAVDAKKNNFKKGLILLAVIVIIVAAVASKGSEFKDVSAYEGLEDSEKQKEKKSISKHKEIGEQVKIGELNFTVHGTKVAESNEFRKPSEGNQFLYVDLTVENKGSKQAQMTSIMTFSLVGKDGKCYNIVLPEEEESLNGLLESGDKMRGKVCFEVPENTHEFELEIKPAVVKAENVIIDIKAEEVTDIS